MSSNKLNAPPATNTHLEPEMIAVITAAAMAVIGKPFRLKSVHLVGQHAPSSWGTLGRIQIQASHNLRKGHR